MPEANQKDLRDDELPIRVLRRYQRANTVQLARRFATEAFGIAVSRVASLKLTSSIKAHFSLSSLQLWWQVSEFFGQ